VPSCVPANHVYILQMVRHFSTLSSVVQGFIKFPRDTSKLGFGYASIAHEPAYPIKTSPNPKPAADGPVPLVPFRRAAQLTAAATSQQ
jgi:hypothetical protein